jgi:RNA polymerase sigma factor for flagellar operon FliA
MRAEALVLLRDGMNSQLDPELVAEEDRPDSRVARKKAAYYAAIAANSDFRGRLEVGETPLRPVAPRELPGSGLSAAG